MKCALCGKTLDETNDGTAIHSAAGCALTGLGAWDENWLKINAAIDAARADQRKPEKCLSYYDCGQSVRIRPPENLAKCDEVLVKCCPCAAWKKEKNMIKCSLCGFEWVITPVSRSLIHGYNDCPLAGMPLQAPVIRAINAAIEARVDTRRPEECRHWSAGKAFRKIMVCEKANTCLPNDMCPCAAWTKKEKSGCPAKTA